MSRKKLPAPAPAVVSTGCSSLMSCLPLHRRGPAANPRRRNDADGGGDAVAAAEQYWKRVQFLEEEIRRLSKWVGQEERPAPAAECVVRGSAKATEEHGSAATNNERVRNGAKAREEGGNATVAMTTSTKRCISVVHGAGAGVEGIVRLEDGSYLREVRRVGRPWERLAVQVSRPVVPEDAASVAEVLDKMTAMRAEDLCKFLIQIMPLKDIAGQQNPGDPVRRTARLSSGDDLVEALIFKSMDKLEGLVLEGLKIQMASAATDSGTAPAPVAADRQRHEAVSKDCLVHVVLMQVRDPKERYGAIGDLMIGLIEESLESKDGKVKLEVQGMHVAGISFVNRKLGVGRCMMWSASLRRCKGSHNGGGGGDCCRCNCVRNPNRVFQR
ncbi:uncharacterized protein LOC133902279 [Phragmites australis]|uniref:uncharacterized protein LOC133902279 n=1 Tax=Phragmites australis TaxID=29695 RepID=UPI002D78F562|nr:uncharacterized protein LOC133902279 [Phragmites australis]